MTSAPPNGEIPAISTVIIALDEVAVIERCVRSCLPFSDEILVVDAGSSDGTQELVERLGGRVIHNPWPGYAVQRNFGADAAENDWIFSIDCDEAVDEELQGELARVRGSRAGRPAYRMDRVNSFMGVWLTDSPEPKVRLYDRRRAGFTPRAVHEVVDVDEADAEPLAGTIWHVNREELHAASSSLNLYTSLEAEIEASRRRWQPWRLFLRPVARFGQRYVLQRAFRHGWRGLFLALHWAHWELLREMKVYERRHRRP